MRRETQNVLLVLLGGALLKISFTGAYLNYVKPAQRPWLIAAGAVMVLLALAAIARDVRAGGAADGHSHDTRAPWLLLVPVLAIFLIAPPALGSDSVNRTSSRAVHDAPSAEFPPLPGGAVVALSLSDFTARAGWDRARSLADRSVDLTGFVVRRDGAIYLARLVIACCAADAFPVRVRLIGDQPVAVPDDTWVRVTVRLVPGSAGRDNEWVPAATVEALTVVAAPEDPYEY